MNSVHLDADQAAKVERAAKALGMSQSEFIRDALARRCAEVLCGSLAERLGGVIGIVNSTGRRADKSGLAFRIVLARRRRK